MSLITKAVRGTSDILPAESGKWNTIENYIAHRAKAYGFREIRTPVFEHTALFKRSVGELSDVVQKEMYTFDDKGGRSLTLRPEGTAGVVRAVVERGLLSETLPLKLYYFTTCYRYEKPQAGRLREFHQFGAEIIGAAQPQADGELIAMAYGIFTDLGIPKESITLKLNSIGCPECRGEYRQALTDYLRTNREVLCELCRERMEGNPLRVLDCKNSACGEIAKAAPKVTEYLCPACAEHFEKVKEYLHIVGIPFALDTGLVRGLDYYTRTVFEFVSSFIGAQGTCCGGGRYDGLVREIGGKDTPSLGFAFGLERLMLLIAAASQVGEIPGDRPPKLYVAQLGEETKEVAYRLVNELRLDGFTVETDITGRSLKGQMKHADKLSAEYVVVLGEDEISSGVCKLKNMSTGEAVSVSINALGEKLIESDMIKAADFFKNNPG